MRRTAAAITAVLAALGALVVESPEAAACYTDKDVANCLKLDRVEAEPSWIDGLARVRLYVSAVNFNGPTVDVSGEHAWQLYVGSSRKKVPYFAGTFENVDDPVAVGFVFEVADDYEKALPLAREAAKRFLEGLPKSTKAVVMGYGEDLYGGRKTLNQKRAENAIDQLDTETERAEMRLLAAIDKVIGRLRRARARKKYRDVRKMIIVVSDGHDEEYSKERFRKIAKKANRYGIRIHTMAHSPFDDRGKMLGLAELSKMTHGTFRLVRDTKESFRVAFQQLLEEVNRQYVLTFYLPAEEVMNKRLKVGAIKLVSNKSSSTKLTCGAKERCEAGKLCYEGKCVSRKSVGGRGFFGWILLIGGILLGIVVVLFVVGLIMTRLSHRKSGQAALAQAVAEAQAQAPQPDANPNRIAPQDAYGKVVSPSGGRQTGHVGRQTGHVQGGGQVQPVAPGGRIQPAGASAGRVSVGAAGQPVLFVVTGPMQGTRLPLRHGFRIGKAPDCDYVIATDNFASSHHAHVVMDKGGNCTLVDEGSTNGTFINGVRANRTRLTHGMLIKIGQTELRFLTQ
jgi:hypothetical protein